MSHAFANFDVVSSIVLGSMRAASKCIAKRGGQKRDQSINAIRSKRLSFIELWRKGFITVHKSAGL